MKEYLVKNALNGIVTIVIAKSWLEALERGRAWFGTNQVKPAIQ